MICDPFFPNSKFHFSMALKPGEGARALRFALIPPPDPYPLSLTVSSRAEPYRVPIPVGLLRQRIKVSWAKHLYFKRNIFAHIKTIQERRSPIQIEARQGFAHIESVRVEWDGALGKGQRAYNYTSVS